MKAGMYSSGVKKILGSNSVQSCKKSGSSSAGGWQLVQNELNPDDLAQVTQAWGCSTTVEAEAAVSVNEKKWLVIHMHVQLKLGHLGLLLRLGLLG
jgi:hypothetical protein